MDILARAKNGTGKTGAYLIPVLQNINTSDNTIQGEYSTVKVQYRCRKGQMSTAILNSAFRFAALIIVPTR